MYHSNQEAAWQPPRAQAAYAPYTGQAMSRPGLSGPPSHQPADDEDQRRRAVTGVLPLTAVLAVLLPRRL